MAAPLPGTPGGAPPAAPEDSLLQSVLAFARELPGLLGDRLELLELELRLAGRALQRMVLMLVALAVLGVTAWIVLWGALAMMLINLGLAPVWALLVLLLANGVAIAVLLAAMRSLLPHLQLAATRRHLKLSPSPLPRPEQRAQADPRHDPDPRSPDAPAAGQPAAR